MLAAGNGLPELTQPAGDLPSNSRTQPPCFSWGESWLSAARVGCDRHTISSDDRDKARENVGRMEGFLRWLNLSNESTATMLEKYAPRRKSPTVSLIADRRNGTG